MGMVGLFSYDRLGAHLVDWYARPVMNALIEAEERSRRAEDRGRHNNLVYGADLASLMDLQFRVGKQIPREWRALEPGLHFFDRMENFVFLEEHKGVRYALSGHTGLLVTIKAQLVRQKDKSHSKAYTDTQIDEMVAAYFEEKETLTRSQFQEYCGLTYSTAVRHLKRLRDEKKIVNIASLKHPLYRKGS